MTENEAIELLNIHKSTLEKGGYIGGKDAILEYDTAVKALEEVQQYRVIGTVERFQQLTEQFKPHTTDETSCPERHCNKCDKYRKEAERYQAIGTVEECQEAREKQRARKPIGRKELKDFSGQIYSLCGKCPRCGAEELLFVHTAYCPKCGQAILWNFD